MFKKIIDQFSRFFVGGLFIFSGLIKLNDPIGIEIKLEEYFEVFADDFGSFFHLFTPYALTIGMILIVLEIALGVAVLLFYRMRQTTVILLLLMIFFTFLTFYSAYFNKVTDCGCFGDAIKLTPWQSFYKDIILMVFVLHLFWYRKTYQAMLYTREGYLVMSGVLVICFSLGIYALLHLPFIDFRAYKRGNNIPRQMQPQEKARIAYTFEKDGDQVISEKFLPESEGYKYVSSKQLNEEAARPKITDYAVFDTDGNNVTDETFQGVKLLFICYDVGKSSEDNISNIRSLINSLDGKVDMMLLTSSQAQDVESFRHKNQLAIPYYFVDATVLKTMIRSNPGIALWKDGTVIDMWHHNDTPDAETIIEESK